MTPLRLTYPPAAITDLRERLGRTRWPEPETTADWSQGVPLAWLRALCDQWADEYDFEQAQRRLNTVPHFRAVIDGLGIAFYHQRSPHPNALPIILTHGWPSASLEFLDVIGDLTHPDDPADAFHVVAPSLPGFGWSDRPSSTGWTAGRTARAWSQLMSELGYERYAAHGGDWGSIVTTELAAQVPQRLVGVHVNVAIVDWPRLPTDGLTAIERAHLDRLARHRSQGAGYAVQQATRPQTVGYGLVDSPAAQCAWIAEKFHDWTDGAGWFAGERGRTHLLDTVSAYWFTATAASSARLYWESHASITTETVRVPAGVSSHGDDVAPVSRRWAATRFSDLRWFRQHVDGGHFPAAERPARFVGDLRDCFRDLRPPS